MFFEIAKICNLSSPFFFFHTKKKKQTPNTARSLSSEAPRILASELRSCRATGAKRSSLRRVGFLGGRGWLGKPKKETKKGDAPTFIFFFGGVGGWVFGEDVLGPKFGVSNRRSSGFILLVTSWSLLKLWWWLSSGFVNHKKYCKISRTGFYAALIFGENVEGILQVL